MNRSAAVTASGFLIPILLGLFLVATSGFDLLPQLGVLNGKRVIETVLLALVLAVTALHPQLRASFGRLLGFLRLALLRANCLIP